MRRISDSASTSLTGLRVLVVEDEYLAAQDMARMVEALGGTVVGPVGRLSQAFDLVNREPIDGAILDVKLNGDMIYALADELFARNIRIVLATGYDTEILPDRFHDMPVVRKPVNDERMTEIAQRVFG